MYGMVNEGIRQFVGLNHDEATWETICSKAAVSQTSFERMASYDDAITYQLVGAICDHMNLSGEEALESFGAYWVEYVGSSSFGNLLKLAGRTLTEKLDGLDDLHARVFASMPNLKPPSFELETLDDIHHNLHYFSDRDGLAPMVVGLVHGLANVTGETVEVHQIEAKADGADHDVFAIKLLD